MKHIDFDYVPEYQKVIDSRLRNWQRWVSVRPGGWKVHPMFRQAQSNSRQWHQPEIKDEIDILDAQLVEKYVSELPNKQRTAIRWFYVFRNSPVKTAKTLAVNKYELQQLVIEARDGLANKMRINLHAFA
jgi:DNA-directed RNA polymerase specialized sigma24 family protein